MSLKFTILNANGDNYLSWKLDASVHLVSKTLRHTVEANNNATLQEKAKAAEILRRHIHENLKEEFVADIDPKELWDELDERFNRIQYVLKPRAQNAWSKLRFQDFKNVSTYNSAIYKLKAQLFLCGETITDEQMIDKTLSTFHASHLVLAQQYRAREYTRFSDLKVALLIAEEQNELLMQEHNSRPTGAAPLPEANAIFPQEGKLSKRENRGKNHGKFGRNNRTRKSGRGRSHGYNSNFYPPRNNNNNKRGGNTSQSYHRGESSRSNKTPKNICFKCGITGHWANECRTAKHLQDLYQASRKGKGKEIETNLNYLTETNEEGATHLEIDNFQE